MAALKFIQVTDVHLISGGRRLYGVSPERRLHAAIDSINQEHSDADFVVFTGDLVHWPDAESYAIFAEAIKRLAMPVKLMVGNHDDPHILAQSIADVQVEPDGFVQHAHQTPAGRCLFLDTRKAGSDAGEYCSRRIAWLNQQLDASDDPVMLFMHHPPLKLGLKGMDEAALLDQDALFAVIEPHLARVRHLFFGHVHRPVFGNWRGMSYSCMRGLNHQVALDLDAPETSVPASFEPPAYGVVLADRDQIVIHMHEFLDRSPRFDLVTPAGDDPNEYSLNMRHGDWDRMN
ncbi:MAG: phosphodiesterase [Alphaproteobacteria bacterium]|nr:phosphodiesterase [Alphaproteobacteria bacterium]